MSISIDGGSLYQSMASQVSGTSGKTDALKDKLTNVDVKNATDEELMEACKEFETYFTEQVYKEMRKTVHSSDDEGEYMQYFGDMLGKEYAQSITDSGSLGIAQVLYDSMKRNS